MKKIVLALTIAFFCQLAIAETCPSVNDIKNNLLADWSAHDSEDGHLLNTKETDGLAKNIAQFALAEWTGNEQSSEVRCYYRDLDGSELEAYYSKKDYIPNNADKRWYQVSGHMHCAAGMDKCLFTSLNDPQHQLAHN